MILLALHRGGDSIELLPLKALQTQGGGAQNDLDTEEIDAVCVRVCVCDVGQSVAS